jgi:Sulfotransferase family
MALQGHLDEVSHRRVYGWVIDTDHPESELQVVVTIDGHEYGRCTANQFRPNLIEHLGNGATGNHEFCLNFEPKLSPFRQHDVRVTVVGFPHQQLPGNRRIIPAGTVTRSAKAPLLVTSTGRSGTTMLMSEFLRHQQIVVADSYPYEIKLISYYASAFRALVSEADRENSTHPDQLFTGPNKYRIGHNPFFISGFFGVIKNYERMAHLFEEIIFSTLAQDFRGFIDRYYQLVSEDQGKTDARLFAEKCDIDETAREGARMFYTPVREVVLVRDARDLLCSAMAFWKFSLEDALRTLESTLPRLADISRAAGEDTLIVRYEDLMRDPVETRKRMYQFIGVDAPAAASSGDALFGIHGTSRDAAASVGRWQQDLAEAAIDRCEDLFADYLARFGYERRKVSGPNDGRLHVVPNADIHRYLGMRTLTGPNGKQLWAIVDRVAPSPEFAEHLLTGWSGLEQGWVWSNAERVSMRFEWPAGATCCRLVLVGRPFVSGTGPSSQRLIVEVDNVPFGQITISRLAAIDINLKKRPLENDSQSIIALGLPDAARPSEIDPKATEKRLLSFALERIIVYCDVDSSETAL